MEHSIPEATGEQPNIVHLHLMPTPAPVVHSIEGVAWLQVSPDGQPQALEIGRTLAVGDTVSVAAHGRVLVGRSELAGGVKGCAHAWVPADAFAPSPGLSDLPQLIRHLQQLSTELGSDDPLAEQEGPQTPYERSLARDFALHNMDPSWCRKLPCELAHELRAVALFCSQDTAFVAVDGASVPKLLTLVQTLSRPVNSHLVSPEVIDELLGLAYPP